MVVDKRGVIMERLQQHRHHLLHRQHRAVRVELLLHLLTLHARPHEPRVLSPTLVVEVKLHENNFNNALLVAFVHTYLKNKKKTDDLTEFFAILGSARLEAFCKMLMKLTPTRRGNYHCQTGF